MSLSVKIERNSGPALYQQIAEQIKTHISSGRLPAGTRLPTVRQLAADVGVTRLTVHNAYSELQADGWIEATVGRGTFVSRSIQPHTLMASVGQYLTPDGILSDMMHIQQVAGVRSMAMAHPDSKAFPADEFWSHIIQLQSEAASLMEYGPIQGDGQLRVAITTHLKSEHDLDLTPDDIMITAGGMQAISLITQALAQPGDSVLVEQPTFLGTLNTLKAQGIKAVSVPLDEAGPCLDELERILRHQRPRFYYTIPTYHNPTGICTTAERRSGLIQLAEKYNLTLVEDDIYRDLYYDAPPPPPLHAQAAPGRVIYLSSFSKVLMPGLRIGYLVTTPQLRTRLLSLRRAADLCSPLLPQRALARFLQDGGLKRQLKRIRPLYRERRDVLLQALQTFMPDSVKWTHPTGGFCCWVTLPGYFPPGALYRAALEHGFAFTPGEAYETRSGTADYLRLCFSNQSRAGVRTGVRLLSQLIREQAAVSARFEDRSRWMPVI